MGPSSGRVKLAEAMIQQGSHGPAMQLLRQHLSSTPGDQKARYLLGVAAYRSGDNGTAERAFSELVAQTPTLVPALYYLGITVARMGRVDEARHWLSSALSVDPSYTAARERLAQLTPVQPGPTAEPAKKAEQAARLTPGGMLHSGRRRISSYAGRFLFAAIIGGGGATVLLTYEPGRLRWMAERMTFPSPSYFADLLERVRGTPLEAMTQRDLDNALAQVAATSSVLDIALVIAAIALSVLAVLLVVHAILAAGMTRYDVYQRRIDVARGVLNRRRISVWLYEITDVQLRQPVWLTLTGNAEVRLILEDTSKVKITGFGSTKEQLSLWEEIRDAALIERRELKSIWV